jgi:hypothetical protein
VKAIALRKIKFTCNGNLYECEKGQEVEIKSTDLEQAKASKLFEIKEPVKKTPKKDS